MGLQNLEDVQGTRISQEDVNKARAALRGDHVPRAPSGAPQNNAGNLGNEDYQWNALYAGAVFINGVLLSATGGGSVAIPSGKVASGATIRTLAHTSGFLYPLANGQAELFASDQSPLVFTDTAGTNHTLTAPVRASFPSVSATNRGAGTFAITQYDGLHNTVIAVVGAQSAWENARGKQVGIGIGGEYFVAHCDFIAGQYILTQCRRGEALTGNSRSTLTATEINAIASGSVMLYELFYLFVDPSATNPQISATREIYYSYDTPPPATETNIWVRGSDNSLRVRSGNDFVAYNGIYVGMALVGAAGCVAVIPTITGGAMDLYTQSKIGIPAGELSGWEARPEYADDVPPSPASDITGGMIELGRDTRDLSHQRAGDFFATTRVNFDFADDLESGLVLTTDTVYFCYIDLVSNTKFISAAPPLRLDLAGRRYYAHPHRVAVAVATFYRRDNSGTAINVDFFAIEQNTKFDFMDFTATAATEKIGMMNINVAGILGRLFSVELDVYLSALTRRRVTIWDGHIYGDFELYSDDFGRAETTSLVQSKLDEVDNLTSQVNRGEPRNTGSFREGNFVDNSERRAAIRSARDRAVRELDNVPVFTGSINSSGIFVEAKPETISATPPPMLPAAAGNAKATVGCLGIVINQRRTNEPDNTFPNTTPLRFVMRPR